MNIIRTLWLLLFIVACTTSQRVDIERSHSYQRYLDDRDRISQLYMINDCDSTVSLLDSITSIDFLSIKERRLNDCGITFSHPFLKNPLKQYPEVDRVLSEIMNDDQLIRDSLTNALATQGNFENTRTYIAFKQNILRKTDSLNAVKFDSLVSARGEWLGAVYRDVHPSNPPIEIFISHLDAESYVRYTRMAYRSALEGKEYWSRVVKLVGFAQKYMLYDSHILKHNLYVVPFRFVEFENEYTIDEDADLTRLEFQNLSSSDIVRPSTIQYELMSNYADDEKRNKLLNQARDILLEQGLSKEYLRVDYARDTLTPHTLSYKIIF